MQIGLIQIDGELPNLALMKLSAWHKSKGDYVCLMRSDVVSTRLIPFDKVYISCIFEENAGKAISLQKQFRNAEIGGIGVNCAILPNEIEHIKPDYSLYNIDYSMGLTTRGCLRKCPFCKVPIAEGIIRANCDIYEFWDSKHKHIVLLDNNILALPQHFKKIATQINTEKLSVDFNQGLDIRLLNENNAKILSGLRIKPNLRFAFDSMEIEPQVLKGIGLLQKFDMLDHTMWYVLVGYNTTIEQDLHRLNLLKSYKQKPYVMRYKTVKGQKIYNDLSSWANQKQFFASMDFDTFRKCRENRELVIPKPKANGNAKLSTT